MRRIAFDFAIFLYIWFNALCNAKTMVSSFTGASTNALEHLNLRIAMGLVRGRRGFILVNTSKEGSVLPFLFFPSRVVGGWLKTFWMTAIRDGHFIAGSFHSEEKAFVNQSISLHIRSTVPFSHGQYGEVKWWRILYSLVKMFISNATKRDSWSVANHSMHPKQTNHLGNELVAPSLSGIAHSWSQV